MSLTLAFRTWVGAQASLAAHFGAGELLRCWHQHAPEGTEGTYLVFHVVGGEGHAHMGGAAAIRSPLLQVNVWGRDAGQVQAAAAALRDLLHGFRGLWGAVNVRRVTCAEPVDVLDFEDDGAGVGRPGARLEAQVWYAG